MSNLCDKKLKMLYRVSRFIGEALNLDKALSDLLTAMSESLAMKRATVVLRAEGSQTLSIRASCGLTSQEIGRGVYQFDEGVTGRIFKTAKPYIVPDINCDPLFLNKTGARGQGVCRVSFIGVPIMLGGEPIGVLSVDRLFGDNISPDEDVEFLTILAALIAQLVNINKQVVDREEKLVRTVRSLKAEISEKYEDFFMVGQSRVMRDIQFLATKVASSKATVLLLGESGTGKTLIARIIHEMSQRADRPFVKLNCAAIPENLLESELFGYEKGAFTGAAKVKAGRIEEAEGGTLFLDEVGELPLLLQTKLLRFLQEKEFERLGSNRTRTVDVRVITATNKVLTDAVRSGSFREDLYYRLNVFPIMVPALRERTDDIPILLSHFLNKFAKEYNRPLSLSEKALEALTHYAWPGNVREMENLVERLAILCEEKEIGLTDLPDHILGRKVKAVQADERESGSPKLEELEKVEVLEALRRNGWVQTGAANELGLTLRQLGYRIKKFGLEEEVFRGKRFPKA